MRRSVLVVSSVLLLVAAAWAEAQAPSVLPTKVRKVALGGEGGWDYLTADPVAKRLYVSRGNRVIVVDTESEKSVGELEIRPVFTGSRWSRRWVGASPATEATTPSPCST